jgi:hypothetical protein
MEKRRQGIANLLLASFCAGTLKQSAANLFMLQPRNLLIFNNFSSTLSRYNFHNAFDQHTFTVVGISLFRSFLHRSQAISILIAFKLFRLWHSHAITPTSPRLHFTGSCIQSFTSKYKTGQSKRKI